MNNMSNRFVHVLAVFLLAAVVAACSGNKGAGGSSVTSDVPSGTTIDDGSATSVGVGRDGGLSAEEMAARGLGGLRTVFYFDFDQSTLSSETRAALDAQANVLRSQAGVVRLEGHADERGSREYNIALGQRRADAAKRMMTLYGAQDSQIETVSFGKEKPRNPGNDEAAYAENRRDDIVYAGE